MAKRKSVKRTRRAKSIVHGINENKNLSALVIILALLLFVFSAVYMSRGGI